ncbi:hypothetical protein HN51_038593 [Arachis hypogaea]|nr:Proteinaceous RNase P [Arachis hypogaea]
MYPPSLRSPGLSPQKAMPTVHLSSGRPFRIMALPPRLRTFDHALFRFCELINSDKTYEVEEHVNGSGVTLEEPQLMTPLKVSAKNGNADKVYEYLHKLRSSVRCVSEMTTSVIEEWFHSGKGSEVGLVDLGRMKEGILQNGGGWHGQGWVGKGDWHGQGCACSCYRG